MNKQKEIISLVANIPGMEPIVVPIPERTVYDQVKFFLKGRIPRKQKKKLKKYTGGRVYLKYKKV